MFESLAAVCHSHELAWDCATGNGQAAHSLVRHFAHVIGTDASEQQIASANGSGGLEFRVAQAENSGLADHSVDLITVAQALHWFDIDAFFDEADRVLKSGGVLAFWCYQNCIVDEDVDPIVFNIFTEVDDYWPPERTIVEDEYPTIAMPFEDVDIGEFCIVADWNADQLLDYVRTWSATQRFLAAQGHDPVESHAGALRAAWGKGSRQVHWPIVLRVGRK